MPFCFTFYCWLWESCTSVCPACCCSASLPACLQSHISWILYFISHNALQTFVPRGTTEYGKEAFKYVARSSWNEVQKDLTLSESITRGEFKSRTEECSVSVIALKSFILPVAVYVTVVIVSYCWFLLL